MCGVKTIYITTKQRKIFCVYDDAVKPQFIASQTCWVQFYAMLFLSPPYELLYGQKLMCHQDSVFIIYWYHIH